MKRKLAILPLVLCLTIASLYAVENKYADGKILDVQQKVKTRVLYYLVNTPVTQDDPYFEVSVQVKGVIYRGDYTPRHSADTLPEEWKPAADVKVRIEKHSMFLERSGDAEVEFVITKRTAATPVPRQDPAASKK